MTAPAMAPTAPIWTGSRVVCSPEARAIRTAAAPAAAPKMTPGINPHAAQVQVRSFKHRPPAYRPPAYAGWDSANLMLTSISPADGHARGTGLNSTAWCELGADAAAAVGAGATVAERRPVFKAVG
jgi:hypothetical protein